MINEAQIKRSIPVSFGSSFAMYCFIGVVSISSLIIRLATLYLSSMYMWPSEHQQNMIMIEGLAFQNVLSSELFSKLTWLATYTIYTLLHTND